MINVAGRIESSCRTTTHLSRRSLEYPARHGIEIGKASPQYSCGEALGSLLIVTKSWRLSLVNSFRDGVVDYLV